MVSTHFIYFWLGILSFDRWHNPLRYLTMPNGTKIEREEMKGGMLHRQKRMLWNQSACE